MHTLYFADAVVTPLYYYLSSPITWINFLFGAIVGSFLNVCIYRIPLGIFWKNVFSVCPQCQSKIPPYLNIPIFSFVILRGKTACCKKPLSIQYPLVELFTAISFVVIYWHFPFIEKYYSSMAIDPAQLLRYIHAILFCCILIVCSVIDLEHMIIPDVISIPMILLSPVVFALHPDLDWQSSFLGIAVGGGVLYAIAWLYWMVRGEVGMGFGDVKLLAGIGGWLGYQAIMPTIFCASITGSLVGISMMLARRQLNLKIAIPFGPFLALGALIHLLFGSKIGLWLIGDFS